MRGAHSVAGAGVPLVGGCAGDDLHMTATHQFFDDRVLRDAVVAAAIGSDAPFGIGVRHGWRTVGDQMLVTDAQDTRVSSSTTGPRSTVPRPARRAARGPRGSRRVPRVRAHTAAGDVPPVGGGAGAHGRRRRLRGAIAHPVRRRAAGPARLGDGGRRRVGPRGDGRGVRRRAGRARRPAAPRARRVRLHGPPRRPRPGDRCRDPPRRRARRGAPVAGFYTYGEIARTHGTTGFHNQTMVVLAVA